MKEAVKGIIHINKFRSDTEYIIHKTIDLPFLKIEYLKPELISHTFIYHTICISLCRIYYLNNIEHCIIDDNALKNIDTNEIYPISIPKQYIYKNISDSKL